MEEQKKVVKDLMKISQKYEVQKIESEKKENLISFEGTPKKDPQDSSKIIIFLNPFNNEEKFMEFPINSVRYVEEIGTETSSGGQSALKVRVWIKKGTMALEAKPFIVE